MNSEQQLVKPDKISDHLQLIVNMSVSSPMVHPKKFSADLGISIGVVGGWIDNGYLPTVKVGKYQLINLVLLTENLKQGFVL